MKLSLAGRFSSYPAKGPLSLSKISFLAGFTPVYSAALHIIFIAVRNTNMLTRSGSDLSVSPVETKISSPDPLFLSVSPLAIADHFLIIL